MIKYVKKWRQGYKIKYAYYYGYKAIIERLKDFFISSNREKY